VLGKPCSGGQFIEVPELQLKNPERNSRGHPPKFQFHGSIGKKAETS
jgi:hypothetical protein